MEHGDSELLSRLENAVTNWRAETGTLQERLAGQYAAANEQLGRLLQVLAARQEQSVALAEAREELAQLKAKSDLPAGSVTNYGGVSAGTEAMRRELAELYQKLIATIRSWTAETSRAHGAAAAQSERIGSALEILASALQALRAPAATGVDAALEAMNEGRAELRSQVAALHAEIESLRPKEAEPDTATAEALAALRMEMSALRERLEEREQALRAMEAEEPPAEPLQLELAANDAARVAAEEEAAELRLQLEADGTELREAQDDVARLQGELEAARNQLAERETELDEARTEILRMEERAAASAEQSAALLQSREQLHTAEALITDLQRQVAELTEKAEQEPPRKLTQETPAAPAPDEAQDQLDELEELLGGLDAAKEPAEEEAAERPPEEAPKEEPDALAALDGLDETADEIPAETTAEAGPPELGPAEADDRLDELDGLIQGLDIVTEAPEEDVAPTAPAQPEAEAQEEVSAIVDLPEDGEERLDTLNALLEGLDDAEESQPLGEETPEAPVETAPAPPDTEEAEEDTGPDAPAEDLLGALEDAVAEARKEEPAEAIEDGGPDLSVEDLIEGLEEAVAEEQDDGLPDEVALESAAEEAIAAAEAAMRGETRDEQGGRIRLGRALVDAGKITEQQLGVALLEQQQRPDTLLGTILLNNGYVSETAIAEGLSDQLGLPFVDVGATPPKQAALDLADRETCVWHVCIPLRVEDDALVTAMSNPLDEEAMLRLGRKSGLEIRPVVATQTSILMAIEATYGVF